MHIGIDLGTTFSALAVTGQIVLQPDYGAGLYIPECDVTIIPSPFGESTFPSVVIEDPQNPGQLLFGAEALSAADAIMAPIMFSKRQMGTSEPLYTGTQTLTAQEVAARFLGYLRQCAERALGQSITRAVITHPAYFDRIAVEQTREAAVSAGFEMGQTDQMLMEPVAAALAYTRTDKRDPLNILTYDLGGGTFDVTVLQRIGGVVDMKAFDGDHLLGGYNFDRELVDWVRQRLESRGRKIALDMSTDAGRAAVADLLRAAEQVKIALAKSEDDERTIEFRARGVLKDVAGKDVPINERISKREFVEMIRPYLSRTADCCKNALSKAHLQPSHINEVLLVGGSSYGPWVTEAIQPIFPDLVPKLFSPDLCVAMGAAIHADMVLPKRYSTKTFSIQLDTPERTVAESISIVGELLSGNSSAFSVRLSRKGGAELDRVKLAADRRFLFREVDLLNYDASNFFSIEVLSGENEPVFSHDFNIIHESQSSDTSAVTTVLPRPLFVETYDGLVPLASEGMALPARIQSTFQRLNDNSNFELKVYQAGEVIGVARIEDIPPEGGKGALVDLQVEVTQKNEIRGKAIIKSPNGHIYAERSVAIRYHLVEIPDITVLTEKLRLLKEGLAKLKSSDATDKGQEIAVEAQLQANQLLFEAERLVAQIPVERQEIYAITRKVGVLLQPRIDDMRPSRQTFFGLMQRCKDTCIATEEANMRITTQQGEGKGLDASMVQSAERTIRKAKDYQRRLDELHVVASEAAEHKNRRKWLQAYDKLTDIEAALRKDDEQKTAPTPVNKLIARREIMGLLAQFHIAAAKIEAEGKIKDWSVELRRIHKEITDLLMAIADVDDSLTDERSLVIIRNIFGKRVAPMKEQINQLGQAVRTLHK